ncbi:pantoate--beta-alanine ligase [Falsihalocynthiibacter arcticus]|uniref:Pantothenate synthetase n=1 Tax=Falsihalocynthiibacter arcticus TaxID=1579316 RepID=A0A126UVL8_9RHOB|nr:pantoate--beta-alanine ligase [Falsihalocynthiibacter arcticus]AML50112.1 pantoate--beta-alanine ligase [Falsihalocynthiibacter arcticus]
MEICRSIPKIRAYVASLRAEGKTVGLVPTMGALHAGHIALVKAVARHADNVIATIFVNPTQFGDAADLAKYPRTEDADLALLKAAGVAAVFMPQVDDIYPEGAETIVETTVLANMLHGLVRPGHYRGVATVVTKLFNIVGPDVAAFGEKDYQQLQVIRKMVRDLHIPIKILPVPTIREADGLAMSSRNTRLTPADRAAAVILSQALDVTEKAVQSGTTVSDLAKSIRATIATQLRGTLEGLDIVDDETLAPISGPITDPTAIMISVQFGDILLIDQRVATPR